VGKGLGVGKKKNEDRVKSERGGGSMRRIETGYLMEITGQKENVTLQLRGGAPRGGEWKKISKTDQQARKAGELHNLRDGLGPHTKPGGVKDGEGDGAVASQDQTLCMGKRSAGARVKTLREDGRDFLFCEGKSERGRRPQL